MGRCSPQGRAVENDPRVVSLHTARQVYGQRLVLTCGLRLYAISLFAAWRLYSAKLPPWFTLYAIHNKHYAFHTCVAHKTMVNHLVRVIVQMTIGRCSTAGRRPTAHPTGHRVRQFSSIIETVRSLSLLCMTKGHWSFAPQPGRHRDQPSTWAGPRPSANRSGGSYGKGGEGHR